MTTAQSAARIAWLAQAERAAALSETALPAWETLDAAYSATPDVGCWTALP